MNRLEIDHVSKRYGDVVALDQMTFDVRAGEIFGFVGSNGAGKTTTMRIILGVLAADAGAVRWAGHQIDLHTRRRIGYMPEERGLYPRMKVGLQLAYLARLHGLDADAAQAAVERWTTRLGVASRVGDDVQKLSLGNQQRVQLAAALVHEPDVLVLDEPFSGLDPVAVDVMSAVLREAADRGVPVLFSSHQLDLVERLCDRVGIVSAGRMVEAGTVDELRAGGRQRLLVVGPEAGRWATGLPGVTVVEQSGPRTVLELGGADGVGGGDGVGGADSGVAADDQVVLQAALAAGPVHEFGRQQASLTDLFRHVVSESTADEEGAA
jgi:ABC-2 type transport system ATP-binding protein